MGRSADAAARVSRGEWADVLGHLDSLVRKSLVVADHTMSWPRPAAAMPPTSQAGVPGG